MQGLYYIYKRTICNRIKKAIKKPITTILLIIAIIYGVCMIVTFKNMILGFELNNPKGLVGLLTMFLFLLLPSNIISYVKRKGLLFKPSDSHFVFTAPFNPKFVLLYAHVKSIAMGLVLGFILSIAGATWFHVPLWKMLLYFIVANIVENILESCLVIILYGNERIPEKGMRIIPWIMYTFILAIGTYLLIVLFNQGFTMNNAINALYMEELQLIPIIGWIIGMMHLLFIGPTTLNIICTILYFGLTALLLYVAISMKCVGNYYEHAMKFADDYQEARTKGKKGEVAMIGKKKKFKKATITYKGYYAKAIFYRQILEYKKNKYFIFGMGSFCHLLIGIVIAIIGINNPEIQNSEANIFIIPGVIAYIAVVFSGLIGKWVKELENPYTYLIPDTSFRKLWYATVMEHIRNFMHGCLVTIPAGIVLGISVFEMFLTVLVCVAIQANKLYLLVLVEGWLGNILGNTPKQLIRIVIFVLLLVAGMIPAFIVTLISGSTMGFITMIVIMSFMTLGCMFTAARIFDKMEAS